MRNVPTRGVEAVPHAIIYGNGESFFGETDQERATRHGHGIYLRADGSFLAGTWVEDELVEEVLDTATANVINNADLQQLRRDNLLSTDRHCSASPKKSPGPGPAKPARPP